MTQDQHSSPAHLAEFYDSKSLPELDLHLAQWICVLKAYRSKVGDCPFQYRERTHVGFFAAASWLTGDPALEEWVTSKGSEADPKRGRCDLWIRTGDFHIEAKHAFCDVSRSTESERLSIESTVETAKASARWLSSSAVNRLAFTFLTPFISRDLQCDTAELTTRWVNLLLTRQSDAIAWYLPERHRTTRFDYDRLSIGTLLLIDQVKAADAALVQPSVA